MRVFVAMAVTGLMASVFVTLPAVAQKAGATIPHVLTVQDEHGKHGNTVYAAGSIGPQAAGPLEHIFVLRNMTDTPLTLDHLQASCACTTASVVGTTDGSTAPVVIAPRQTLSVRVSVDPQQLLPGLLHKSVWVFVSGQAAPAATLEMTGALLPAVSFAPPSLSFGRIEPGTELTLLLRATLRPERLEPGAELRLVSPDPDIVVSEVPQDSAADKGRAFRVRLVPQAEVGRLEGKLSWMLVPSGAAAGTRGPVVETVAWRAEAVGDVAAVPPVVAFGTPTAGQSVVRKVRVTGKGIGKGAGKIGKEWTVTGSSAYLHAAFAPLLGTDDSRELDVRLDPRTPIGPFEARLTVTTQSGEQLILPVYAVVQSAAAAGGKP